jgi:hypothetical protein
LPADATDFRLDIALKELLSWLSEIDADELPPDPPELPEPVLLELLLLLHPAMSSAAVPAATAASPAFADLEYTDVPRLAFLAQTCQGMCETKFHPTWPASAKSWRRS